MLDEHFATELARLDAVLRGTGIRPRRPAPRPMTSSSTSTPTREWRRLYQEFCTHAARNEAFRIEFAARQRDLRARMASVFARWASSYGVTPPVPPADVAAMTFFMADGFLLDQIIDPELDAGLYGRMFEVFMHGLVAMSD